MSVREIFRLAIEALGANKLRSGLTMLGMIIGVGAVVLLVSIGNGAKNYVQNQFEGLGTNLIMVQPGRTDKKTALGVSLGTAQRKMTIGDIDAIQRRAFNIEAITGVSFGSAAIEYLDRKNHVQVLGSNEMLSHIYNIPIAEGAFFSKEDVEGSRRVVTLGYRIARNLFGDESPIGKLVKINNSEYRVMGYFQKGGDKLGVNLDDYIYIPVGAAQRLFNDDRLFGLRARARSKAVLPDAQNEIRDILKERHGGEEDFSMITQESMLSTMNTILGMLTFVLGGIAMISMIVGGIGIMNIMLVSVTERTREIGVRRAVGARQTDIMKQFLAEAIAMSIVGGMIGLIGSVGLTYIVSWVANGFDMRAPTWILFPAFMLSVGTGVIFGVWPARKAAHVETIEALRFE